MFLKNDKCVLKAVFFMKFLGNNDDDDDSND